MTNDEEIKLVGESERGARARRLLEDDLLKECISKVEEDILAKWKSSPISDAHLQSLLRLKWQALQDIMEHVRDIALTGKMAEQTLAVERSLKERARAAVRAFRG